MQGSKVRKQLYKITCFCNAMSCFNASLSASSPLLLLTSFIFVHALPGHRYILQLFTKCSFIASSCLHPVSVFDGAIVFLLVLFPMCCLVLIKFW